MVSFYCFLNDIFSSFRPGLPIIRGFSAELYSTPTFKEHIFNKLHKACTKSCAPVRRISRSVPSNITFRLFKSFTLPHLQHCSPPSLGVERVQVNCRVNWLLGDSAEELLFEKNTRCSSEISRRTPKRYQDRYVL